MRWVVLMAIGVASCAAAGDITGSVRVIDGDTIAIGDEKLRLFGIDAPELGQMCTTSDGQAWDCGAWASQEVRRRYQDKVAECRVKTRDRYGRHVARCWVDGADIAKELVRDGVALAYAKYSRAYVSQEADARRVRRGVHAGSYTDPATYRKSGMGTLRAGCVIKGNIGQTGRKIYHLPGQVDYDRTRISEKKGERWFCTEAEAQAQGWVRARR